MIYFSSDFHLGHVRILEYCAESRPFSSLDEMNRSIIDTLNSQMVPGDLLYFLGDGSLNHKYVLEFFPQINADIVYLPGNHCKTSRLQKGWQKTREMTLQQVPNIRSFHDELIIDIGRHKVLLSHFPWIELSDDRHAAKYSEWRPSRKDYPGVSYALFGHIHSKKGQQFYDRGIDVGIDPWGRAVTYEEIAEIINART